MSTGICYAIGAEASADRLILVKAVRGGTGRVVYAGGWGGEGEAVLGGIRRDVEAGRAFLAVAAPAAQTVVRRLTAPFGSKRKARRVWGALLDVALPFPVEDAACAYGEEGAEGGHATVLAAAIRGGDLGEGVAWHAGRGLDATHVDVAAWALWDGQVRGKPPAGGEGATFLVWLGEDCSLCLRGRGRELLAVHVVRHAGAGWEERAALLRNRLAIFLEGGGEVWWAGPGAEGGDAAERLGGLLPVGLAVRQAIHARPGEFLARGLARRALVGCGVNLRCGGRVHGAIRRRAVRAWRGAAWRVMGLAGLVVLLDVGWGLVLAGRGARVEAELHTVAGEIVGPGLQAGQEELMAERAVERRDAEMAVVRRSMAVGGTEGALGVLLGAVQGKGVEFSRLQLGGEGFTLEGSARDVKGVEGVRDALVAAGWRIQVEEDPGGGTGGGMRFILKGVVVE